MATTTSDKLIDALAALVREEFTPHFGQLDDAFPDNESVAELADAGTECWLDTGDIDAIEQRWNRRLRAVTTNNSLLNKEVQKGIYDDLIARSADVVRQHGGSDVDERTLALEITFVLNARHALRLVEKFDAFVSVEEHTDLAFDADAALTCARRYHAICPERFYVKIPFTAAGLVAARHCHEEGIPVNLTLDFSARQNYLAARYAHPWFCNVFMGRLNSFVSENDLGSGDMVGEATTLASQRVVRRLRESGHFATRQIGASIRNGQQLVDLAGLDVYTTPTAAYDEFLASEASLFDRTDDRPMLGIKDEVDRGKVGLHSLFGVPDELANACDVLDGMDPGEMTADLLADTLRVKGVRDLIVDWDRDQLAASRDEGKIPMLSRWGKLLVDKAAGLDALMNLAGYSAFANDQDAMDARVREVLARG